MFYELHSIEYNKNKIKHYIIKDTSGSLCEYSPSKVRDMLSSGLQIHGLYLDKANRIRQRRVANKSPMIDIEILSNDELISQCVSDVSQYKPRDFVDSIVDFCSRPIYDRVYVVYGLRRSGKTVALKHSILKLYQQIKGTNFYLITINDEIEATEFLKVLSKLNNGIVMIDEITRVRNIISLIHILSDILSASNKLRIVLTGTDSYVFNLANQTSLFGRAYYTHSTLISYSEYNRITGMGLNQYMSDGTLFGKLYTNKSIVDNINGMVIGNIVNTLDKNKAFLSSHAIYSNIAKLNSGMLGAIIYYILIAACDTKFKRSINSIANRPLGKAKVSFLANALNISPTGIPKFITNISNNDFNMVIAILEQLDLIKKVENLANLFSRDSDEIEQITDLGLCTTQPGLLWSLLNLFNTPKDLMIGKATENLILLSLYSIPSIKEYSILNIGYLRYEFSGTHHEIDVALRISNNKTFDNYNIFIEVKSNTKKSKEYTKHLSDKSLNMFNPHKRIVIYNGETDLSKSIKWVNVIDFITNPWRFII